MPRALPLVVSALLATSSLVFSAIPALCIVVPDDLPTIQAAIDSGAEEVSIRPGSYPETPVVDRPMTIRGLLPVGSTDLPEMAGLVLDDANVSDSHSQYIRFIDLRVRGPVTSTFHLGNHSGPAFIEFTRCVLDSGVTDELATVNSQHSWSITRCTIVGPIRISRPEQFDLIDNLIAGGASLAAYQAIRVHSNRFEGPGPVAVAIAPRCDEVAIVANTMRGFETGIHVEDTYGNLTHNLVENCSIAGIRAENMDYVAIRNNTVRSCGVAIVASRSERVTLDGNLVEDCASGAGVSSSWTVESMKNRVLRCGSGIVIGGEDVRSLDNHVQDCLGGISISADDDVETVVRDSVFDSGGGIWIRSYGSVSVADCRVVSSAGTGIHVIGRSLAVTGCVVGRAGGPGILLEFRDHGTADIRGNTTYLNAGSGQVIAGDAPESGTVERNAAFRNGGHGLEHVAGGPLAIACNDWFENQLGPVQGTAPAASDLAADPAFCDVAGDDVHLDVTSPLVDAPGCGRIGALGVGCQNVPTPAQVTLFDATWLDGGVGIRWRLAGAARSLETWIERSRPDDASWSRVTAQAIVEAEVATVVDREVSAGQPYHYRLMGRDRDGVVLLAGPLEVAAREMAGFRLTGVSPNPSGGAVQVEFEVARRAPIEIGLFDLQGRNLATLARGTWPAGRHSIAWSGAGAAAPLEPGLYFIRYRYPGGQALARLVRSR